VNSLIAKINLPGARFDNFLEALHPANATAHKNAHDNNPSSDPCTLAQPPKNANHITPIASLMGVDHQPKEEDIDTTKDNSTEETPQATRVCISEATVSVDAYPTPAAPANSRKLILQSALQGMSKGSNSSLSDDEASQTRTHIKEMHDCTNKLFRVFSEDGMQETSYHVSGFAGLNPVWPIIKLSMALIWRLM
jgi:hypothetical protein